MTTSGTVKTAPNPAHRVGELQSSHRAGFTLVELLIVVFVLSILATIAMPRVEALRRGWMWEEAQRRVGVALRELSARAVAHDREIHLREDRRTDGSIIVVEHRVPLPREPFRFEGTRPTHLGWSGEPLEGYALVISRRFDLRLEPALVTIHRDGTMEPCTVHLTDARDHQSAALSFDRLARRFSARD